MMNYLLNHSPLLYFTQSLWRDEAFSVLIAIHRPIEIVTITANDFTPPLYYILLHYWMLLFGTGEIAIRTLSLICFIGVIYGVYLLSKQIARQGNIWFIWTATLLTVINPMLVYYAFEARTYMLTTLFAVFATYFFVRKKWFWYIIVLIAGLYSHPYIVFLLLSHGIYALLAKDKKMIKMMIKNGFIIVLLYLPWLVVIYFQLQRSGSMWFYDVDRNLIEAVLGNLYLGYEGTPYMFWLWSKYVSLLIVIALIYSLTTKIVSKRSLLLILLWLVVPLVIVLGVSFVKTIYVMRYVTFVTVAEVFVVSIALATIPYRLVRVGLIGLVLIATTLFNFWYAPYHSKVDFRQTFKTINPMLEGKDIIIAESALSFFESKYYAKDIESVYLYNPSNKDLPQYVGSVLIPHSLWKTTIGNNDTGYIIREDGTYEKI